MPRGNPSRGGQPRCNMFWAAFCPLYSTVTLHKILTAGTSLVVQWLRICLPVQRIGVQPPVRELRSHMPRGN